MRRLVWLVLIAMGVALTVVTATGAGQAVRASVRPSDWGIVRIADLRYGQVGLLFEEQGPRLVVNYLDREWSPPRPPGADVHGVTPAFSDGRLLISRFDGGNRNALGGAFNIFAAASASGTASLAPAPDGRRALQIECSGTTSGFCGAWVQLFDARIPPGDREYLDARPFFALTFQVWTDEASDALLVKVADARWEAREDAPAVAQLHELVESGQLGPRWQKVTLPLNRLDRSVDRSALASVILQSMSARPTRVLVRDMMLVVDPDAPLPPLAEADSATTDDHGRDLAVWIWNTEQLLSDRREADRSLAFLVQQGVNVAFLQLPDAQELRRGLGERVIESDRLRPLLSALHARGIRVYALDGAPSFADPTYHDGVVETVRNVAAYNAAVSPDEQFHGVRYDIEPYLLPGFHGPAQRRILENLLSLTERIVTEAQRAGLVVGLDIPFWYDAPAERTFAKVTVEWQGVVRPMSQHLIDLVDDVSVMAYRTVAYGADGTINHAEDELRFAAERGKRVFVGLETIPLPDEVLLEFWGAPRQGVPDSIEPADRLLVVANGDSARIALHPAGSSPQDLEDVVPPGTDPASVFWWPVARRVEVPSGKLTFARLGPDRLADVMGKTVAELSRYRSFAGFSLHDDRGWRQLVSGRPSPLPVEGR